eukprot:7556966-Pyramimonas_sp.AAC.1
MTKKHHGKSDEKQERQHEEEEEEEQEEEKENETKRPLLTITSFQERRECASAKSEGNPY